MRQGKLENAMRASRMIAVVAVMALLMAGCSGSSSPTTEAGGGATSTVAGNTTTSLGDDGASKGLIVAFQHTSANTFIAAIIEGLKDQAATLGYEIRVIEDNFDQAEQDAYVQQVLASGDDPVGFIWDPADDQGGLVSVRALAEVGVPIVALNRPPIEESVPFTTAYAGLSHFQSGQVSGELMLDARDDFVASGQELSSPVGNLIAVEFPLSFAQGRDLRAGGFEDATSSAPFNILAREPAGFSPDEGYDVMSQLIAAHRDEGIDFVFAHNDQLAVGAIRALEDAGYTPGEDVIVVGGTCHGDLTFLESGQQYGTGLEGGYLSGLLGIQVLDRLINGGTVADGEHLIPADASGPDLPDPLTYYTFFPVLGVKHGVGNVDSAQVWGVSMRELCDY